MWLWFWMGGLYIVVCKVFEVVFKVVCFIVLKLIGVLELIVCNLLVYCVQEMNYLVGFLVDLWESFGDE